MDFFFGISIVLYIGWTGVNCVIADSKNLNTGAALLLSILFSPITGFAYAHGMPAVSKNKYVTKKCPDCMETIHIRANKCSHCGKIFTETETLDGIFNFIEHCPDKNSEDIDLAIDSLIATKSENAIPLLVRLLKHKKTKYRASLELKKLGKIAVKYLESDSTEGVDHVVKNSLIEQIKKEA